MVRTIGGVTVLWLSLMVATGVFAQVDAPPQTIKGDLLSIRGDIYVIKDIMGRLVFLHVDKNTKRERLLVPGEKVEAVVIPGERVVALQPAR